MASDVVEEKFAQCVEMFAKPRQSRLFVVHMLCSDIVKNGLVMQRETEFEVSTAIADCDMERQDRVTTAWHVVNALISHAKRCVDES